MDKRNTLLVTVIAIATLIIVIGTAAFAFFSAQINNNANLNVNVTTSGKQASFIATSSGDLTINVESYMMQESDATQDNLTPSNNGTIANLLTANATLNVSLTGTDDGKETTCTYDVIYTWSGEGSFSEELEDAKSKANGKFNPSKYYIRSEAKADGTEYTQGFKEFTIELEHKDVYVGDTPSEEGFSAEALGETNVDEIDVSKDASDGEVLVLKTGETITSTSTSQASHVDYLVTVRFYNLGINQDSLAGKTFSGTVSIANVVC